MTKPSNKTDAYARITAHIMGKTPKSWLLNYDGAEQWIPASLFSFHSEELMGRISFGDKAVVEIRAWKLRELGWM